MTDTPSRFVPLLSLERGMRIRIEGEAITVAAIKPSPDGSPHWQVWRIPDYCTWHRFCNGDRPMCDGATGHDNHQKSHFIVPAGARFTLITTEVTAHG